MQLSLAKTLRKYGFKREFIFKVYDIAGHNLRNKAEPYNLFRT